MLPKDLRTTKDITAARTDLYHKQQGIDPITKEHIPLNAAVTDHDHKSHHCRAVLHRSTNSWEGKVVNAYYQYLSWASKTPLPELLRNLAVYLERDYTDNPKHNGWMLAALRQYKRLSAKAQNDVLTVFSKEVGGNIAIRVKTFKTVLKDREISSDKVFEVLNEQLKGNK